MFSYSLLLWAENITAKKSTVSIFSLLYFKLNVEGFVPQSTETMIFVGKKNKTTAHKPPYTSKLFHAVLEVNSFLENTLVKPQELNIDYFVWKLVHSLWFRVELPWRSHLYARSFMWCNNMQGICQIEFFMLRKESNGEIFR